VYQDSEARKGIVTLVLAALHTAPDLRDVGGNKAGEQILYVRP